MGAGRTPGPQPGAGAQLGAAALRPPPPLRLGWQDGAGVSESAFLAQPDLSQKGELVQTERIIRLAKAANISQGPKLLPGRELRGPSLAGPSGFAESPVPPHSSFPQKRGQEGLRAERAGWGNGASSSPTGSVGRLGPSGDPLRGPDDWGALAELKENSIYPPQ